MTMWIVNYREDGSNRTNHEYYSNEDAANVRVKYFKNRYFTAWAEEKAIMDKPLEGAPEGWTVWDGVKV